MSKTELVFIPTPGMGHLLSIVELAKLLVQTNDTISILIIIYYYPIPNVDHTKIKSFVESQSSVVDSNRITFITLPSLTNPPDLSSPNFYQQVIDLNMPFIQQSLVDRGAKPAAFVLDLMNVSMIDVANELGVPSYVYFTSGANLLVTMFHFQEVVDDHGLSDFTGLVTDPDVEFDVPGFRNPVPAKVLPWVFFDKEGGGPSLILNLARRFREAKGILVNTILELEPFTIQSLQVQDKVPRIYPVGPLLALSGRGDDLKQIDTNSSSSRKDIDEDDVKGWLDQQPPSSVVFLCFGSLGCFGVDQVKEMANGLEHSGHRFLWSLRKPKQAGNRMLPSEDEIFYEALPEGFLDRIVDRGKVIAWAPQVSVLAHQAVGGFVSHCGWNSILESLWFGVPLATWPIYSEQQLNAFTLVKELGLAVEIRLDFRWDFKKHEGTSIVTSQEVENGIKKLMSMDDEMRRKVQEMGDISKKALQANLGSSHNLLSRFIEEVAEN